jgi:1-acyl-sn-glycerol-3-phosphate acyltransferase
MMKSDEPLAYYSKTPRPSSKNLSIPWIGEGLRQVLLFPLLQVFAPMRVEGIEHLQGEGPYIFAANHSSHLDTPLILAALPTSLRLRIQVAAAADYFFTNPLKGALVKYFLNAFAFQRKGPGRDTCLERPCQLLSQQYHLLIFPEGTRSRDGRLHPFKWGVGKLAIAGPYTVIPTYIEGAYEVFPKGARWPRRRQVVVRFGAPLRFVPSADPARVTAQIERAVMLLSSSRLTVAA